MSEENKKTTAPVEKKDKKRCVVVALLVISIISNIASAWYFSNQTYDKIMKNEYAKFGGKSNYELANQAQAIQLSQQIDQIKQFVEENKDKLPKDNTEAKTEEKINNESTETKKMTQDEIASVKKDAYVEWNKDALITLVEYTDPECPYCIRQARSGVIENMKEKYADKINNILKPFKAVPHKNADAESIALICAWKVWWVEAYSAYYKALFTKNSWSNDGEGIKLEQLTPIAKELKIDTKKFQACYDTKETQSIYESYTAEWTKYGVQWTPGTLVINNKTGDYTLIAGAYPEDEFIKQIDAMIAKSEK